MRRVQQARARELACQQRHTLRLRQDQVVGHDVGADQELGNHLLVNVAVLAQVDRREVKAEHVDRATQRIEPARRQLARAVRGERRVDGVEVGAELARRPVRRRLDLRPTDRNHVGEPARRRRESRVDPDQCLPVGLVLTMWIGVLRSRGQRQEVGRRRHEARGQRELAAQSVHFVEVVRERDAGLRADRIGQGLGDDERIAVAVAPDPRTHPEERGYARCRAELRTQQALERCMQARDLDEERVAVIGEAVVDLVLHPQTGEPQHRRLPQLEHQDVQPEREVGGLVGRQRRAVAPGEQARNLAFDVEDGLALDLGRVRGQHRADQRVVEPARYRIEVDARSAQIYKRVGEIARPRGRSGERVRAPAPVLVDVLGNVGEMREVAEGAHDVQHLGDGQRIQQRGKLLARNVGIRPVRATEADRRLADRLGPGIAVLPRLRPQHLAQHPAQQARVLLEREILVGGVRRVHRKPRGGRRGSACGMVMDPMLALECGSATPLPHPATPKRPCTPTSMRNRPT